MNFLIPKLDPIIDATNDELNFDIGSKKLAKIINNLETPSCFGVYGVWGSGKTSLINLTKKHIDTDKDLSSKIATVFFEAWKYEYSDVPLTFNLLYSIQETLGYNLELNTTAKRMVSVGVASLINPIFKKVIGTDASEAMENVDKLNENLLTVYENWLRVNSSFKDEFEKKIEKALSKSGKEKIVVFIDDLDRCRTGNVIKLLEEIKNYLSIKNVIFVIGVDRQVIVDAINKEYGYPRSYGDEYLNKIISNSILLPERSPEGIINSILGSIEDQQVLEVDEIKIVSKYLARFCKSNRRLTQIIFLKFLLSTQYINFNSLQTEIVNYDQKFSNMKALKLAVFRWCLLQILKPNLFEKVDWENEFVSSCSRSSEKYDPIVGSIAKKGEIIINNRPVEDPNLPHIQSQNVASILQKYLTEGLFIE